MTRRSSSGLSELARLGFAELALSRDRLAAFDEGLVALFGQAADPDQALDALGRLRERAPEQVAALLSEPESAARLIRVLGASSGLAEFFERHPDELAQLRELGHPPSARVRDELLDAVAGLSGEAAWAALRIRYRRLLARLAAWDLEQPAPLDVLDEVAAALADLAAAALEASLTAAQRDSAYPAEQVAATRLAVIGMGKAGARELNYVSDVDVMFVVEAEGIDADRAVLIGTKLAQQTMQGIHGLAAEPSLWEVDANLRPEGKDGALVRTVDSHLVYYERWAKDWEFQALLKARPLAGDAELGERFVAAISPLVWSSASREDFVGSVQRMRERVTAHIPAEQVDVQLKLGPGGLRDVEFTIQLLQLVHGLADPEVRKRSTLGALAALADRGYIGRVEAAEFGEDYRLLRLLEHRLQLSRLRRTHLMPTEPEALRVLARATGLATTAEGLLERWQRTRTAVRQLHEKLFYRPLLSAVAALPEEGFALSSEQAVARLAAIGFLDPKGALAHIAALTAGVSRRAQIQRNLLPVMLQWFAEGADPDQGLLAFRRLSEEIGEAYWYLRMLRDSSAAARRLTRLLSGSRFVGDLFQRIPDAAAWLENEEELRPRALQSLLDETAATIARHEGEDTAAATLRAARRREVLRMAIAWMLGIVDVSELGPALADVTTAMLTGALALAHPEDDGLEFAIIAMGRFGGAELGFGSDADVMYVYRASADDAQRRAEQIVQALKRLTDDFVLPLDLDLALRPEGKNGAFVRSLDSYRAYYERWSLTWEAQALLRSRGVAGDTALLADFAELSDAVRYPPEVPEPELREITRIKARVEAERLPQAADPSRHLKLGRGSLSDVEWLVQRLQLQHAHAVPGLRTTSTLGGLSAAVDAGLLKAPDAEQLREAWLLASRVRSAITLWTARTSDVLPTDRRQLEGIARLLGYPPRSATRLEEDYLRATRRSRKVFERVFYG